jgi:hypothetical protein
MLGFWGGYLNGITLAHNEICNLSYTAISLGWGWSRHPVTYAGNNQVLNNLIYNHMQFLVDGGGIYVSFQFYQRYISS